MATRRRTPASASGLVTIEARGAVALIEQLAQNEWSPDEPWTPLHHDMTASSKPESVRIEKVDPAHTAEWVAVHWSAGEGRPGLIEPLAVHQDHRGHGYGTAMTTAAVDALRQMGSSSAVVCAESANTGAVATYHAAGFTAHPEVTDWHRRS